jgi:PAS domain S-box-containing protein
VSYVTRVAPNLPRSIEGSAPAGILTKKRLDSNARMRRSLGGMSRDGLVRALRMLQRETLELRRELDEGRRQNEQLRRDNAAAEEIKRDGRLELEALERLHAVDEHFFRDQPSRQILDDILDAAIAISGADFGNVQIVNPESGDLEIVTHRGFPQWWLDFWNKVTEGTGVCGTALKKCERVIVEDVEKSPIFAGKPSLDIQRKAGVRAVQSTPLVNRAGRSVGMISTHFKKPGRPPDRVLHLIDLLARQAADLLERIDAESALRLSEAKFSGIVSISADAIITLDESGRITLWNNGAEKIYGYSRAEALGMTLDQLVPDRFRSTYRGYLAQFVAGRDVAIRMEEAGMTFYGLRKSGEEFPADAAISKMEIHGQRIVSIAIRDVTEQKRFEGEMRLLSELGQVLASSLDYEDTLTGIVQLVARQLADYAVLYIQQDGGALRRATAATRDASTSWHIDQLIEIQVEVKPEHAAARVTATKQPILVDVTPDMLPAFAHNEAHLRALRAVHLRSIMGVPLLVRDRCFGALFFKSSTRRYVPADLRLAGEIGRRTALLIENAKLHRAARRAIRARDDVLAIVAHDLRNPLGTVLMEASALMLPQALPQHGPREAGKAIARSANRMKRLIRDLLDVTRIELGALSLERTAVSVAEVVGEFAADRKALPPSPAPELRVDVAHDVGEVFADRDRLLQVLENLVSNSEKFTGPNGVVTVGAAANDGEVTFYVKDTGPGIAQSEIPHVFERYGPRKRTDRRGTGLGLPIVRGIVTAHAGRVWLESHLGEGTTFFFTIPRSETLANALSATQRASAAKAAHPA